ncbi:MAG: hypothetical protein HOP16_03585 [Acidobacteria bacterium]|nr:hypothetical protein [Acidobacteriota bacterium]
MRTLDEFVTDQRLVASLCRKRIDFARKNRRSAFVSRAAGIHREVPPDTLMGLLPPRRHWPRLLRRERATAPDLPAAKAKRLEEFVLRQLADPEHRAWTKRLRIFLDECQARVLGWSAKDVIAPDRFIGIPKGRPGNRMRYRVLAPYALRDAISDSVFASYLRHLIDSRLDTHCYAFRLPTGGAPITHHDAVSDLRGFAAAQSTSTLWVAECDIRGFFDSVSHDVTRRELFTLMAEVGAPSDPRLLEFLQSFLAGYDYRRARERATEQLAKRKIVEPEIYDPDKALKESHLCVQSGKRIGIPQGSAFSSVLANIVLTRADRALRTALGTHRSTFYARYVDDILLASTNRRVATRAMNAYRRALRVLELPDHRPKAIDTTATETARTYWNAKSKAAYHWSLAGQSGIEWIGFLGYQLKRDGALRVRRSSVAKELAKQRRAIDDIIRVIDRNRLRAQRHQRTYAIPKLHRIRYAAMMHLISIGIGYPSQPLIWPLPNGVCWASGFRLLREEKGDLALLRTLDRGRGIVLNALTARLRSLSALPGIVELKDQRVKTKFVVKRDGKPLSYYAQFSCNPRAR